MRILVASHLKPHYFGSYCAEALRNIGHTVVTFDTHASLFMNTYALSRIGRPLMHRRLMAVLEQEQPDLVLAINGKEFSPAVLAQIRRHCPAAVWLVDFPSRYPGWQGKLAAFSHVFANCDPRPLRHGGVTAAYLPLGILERFVRSRVVEPVRDVCFVGTYYPVRGESLAELIRHDIDVEIFGTGWQRAPPVVRERWQRTAPVNEAIYQTYDGSRIGVNLHQTWGQKNPESGLNLRTFEITATNALLACDERDKLGEAFAIGREAVSFASTPQLVESIRHYLDNESARRRMAARARRRVRREHTLERRMKAMIEVVSG